MKYDLSPPFAAIVLTAAGFALAPDPAMSVESGPDAARQLERGTYLVETVGACGNCHMARDERGARVPALGYSGGMRFEEPHFGVAYAANITPDVATGIGSWSDEEIGVAIRAGQRPDGTLVGPPMPIEFYRTLSDGDLAAVVTYLRALPAIANDVPDPSYRFTRTPDYGEAPASVPNPPTDDPVRYGEYLVAFGHCMECHTPRDPETGQLRDDAFGAGGRVFHGPWGDSVARNLTPHESGLRDWSDTEIIEAIRSGKDREGTSYKPPMAYSFYAGITDTDIAAMIAYLRTIDSIPFNNER